MYYVYIIRCEDTSLYCGITTDVKRRFDEHKQGKGIGAKYTRSKKPKSIEAVWESANRSEASRLESAIKKLPRTKKEELINSPSLFKEIFVGKLEDCEYKYVLGDYPIKQYDQQAP